MNPSRSIFRSNLLAASAAVLFFGVPMFIGMTPSQGIANGRPAGAKVLLADGPIVPPPMPTQPPKSAV